MYQFQAVTGQTVRYKDAPLSECVWPEDGLHYIPDWVYTSQEVYDKEMEVIFQGDTWNFVALEAEIPNVGDFKRSYVGATPVVVSRAEDGSVHVFENRCAHRGVEFCRENQGNTKEFVCPYHQWSYTLKGDLQGVPFKRGVDKNGGMPKDFRNEDHGLLKLNVTVLNGVVFASYSDKVEPIEEYLTPEVLEDFKVAFPGKPLKVLGYYRNELPCNWKMYHENLKDPYHATLLHSFLVVFGLFVAGGKSTMFTDTKLGRHSFIGSAKKDELYADVDSETKQEMRSFFEGLRLRDERILHFIKEFDSPWSVTMHTIWPNLVVQREMNTMGIRQMIPNGPNSMIMQWTMFGYEDDTEEMTRHRLRQGNLMGPAGFLGIEDNEAMKFAQEGIRRSSTDLGVVKLDSGKVGTPNTPISEAAIRAMYQYYRSVMGF
ncbi:Rieske 2Fe-2S domain-containing protein [Pusillimonas sp.]|uniref:aromatic ring-hydroxylating oxygenase subunit alpha n=1 Tax=Pusillimonas sp. TaxID=3040095 RepID=UPI0037C5B7D1